jgi:hypothetical protein
MVPGKTRQESLSCPTLTNPNWRQPRPARVDRTRRGPRIAALDRQFTVLGLSREVHGQQSCRGCTDVMPGPADKFRSTTFIEYRKGLDPEDSGLN